MATWENKVEKVIGRMAQAAWHQANHDKTGKKYKKHRPYRLPEEAEELVKILGMHDRKRAEMKAKEIMEGLRRSGVAID
jgi:hypothetical protein